MTLYCALQATELANYYTVTDPLHMLKLIREPIKTNKTAENSGHAVPAGLYVFLVVKLHLKITLTT